MASAHGCLRKLAKNPELKGLLGGFEQVIKPGGFLKTVRVGEPTFDTVVELRRGEHDEWTVIFNVKDAVDQILEGRHFKAQRRTRRGGMLRVVETTA